MVSGLTLSGIIVAITALLGLIGRGAYKLMQWWAGKRQREIEDLEKLRGFVNSAASDAIKAKEACEAAKDKMAADFEKQMGDQNARMRQRDEATYDLLEVLEVVIAPLLADKPEARAALHAKVVAVQQKMYT